MKKFIIAILIFLSGTVTGYLIFSVQNPVFENLNPEEIHKRIIKERDYAITQTVVRGDFRCCINPPCTMCYMEANQWNNFKAGTCACDNLIAQGKEPCPQCKKVLCEGQGSSCSFEPTNTQ